MAVGDDLVERSSTLLLPSSSLPAAPTTPTLGAEAAAPPVPLSKHNHSSNSSKIDISSEYHEIEIRILTKWINQKLSQVGDSIQNISKDLQDGTRLLKLLSILTNNETLLKPERGNMRIHKLSNVSQVLTYLKEQWGQENLPAIGSEAIVNGDLKSTMALTYFIMLKYQLLPLFGTDDTPQPPPSPLPTHSSQSTKSNNDNVMHSSNNSNITMMMEAKAILLYWVQSQLRDYVEHHILSNIHDFSRSWSSGLAFCLLIHSYDPYLIPITFKELIQLSANKENANKLLSMAFNIAAENLNVPKYLEPIDLAFPHEPSIMIYVSELYKHMLLPSTPSSKGEQQQSDNDDTLLDRQRKRLSDISTVSFHQNSNNGTVSVPIIPTPQPSASTTMYSIIPKNQDNIPIHPLDATMEMANEMDRSLSQLPIPSDMTELESYNRLQSQCGQFKRGATVAQLIAALQQELNIIQQLMNESGTTSVTNDTIRDLEDRIHIVSTSIQGVHEEYDIDFDKDEIYVLRMDALEETYEKVRDWVDQVRSWFLEAERIRSWIDEHLDTIASRNQALVDQCGADPLSREITLSDDTIRQLHQEHERLKHEIERFDSDDMDRLRAHVKKLTTTVHHSSGGSEVHDDGYAKKDEDLTPADTSTIEITLTTLNQLNRLTKLLEKRSHTIDLLLLRSRWEDLFGNAVQWIAATDAELDHFLRTKARWSSDEQEEQRNDGDDEDCQYKIEGVIKALVKLEHKIADFDQTTYSDVLDAYQEMEALRSSEGSMPDYLEARQVGFEKAFEDLMKRSSYSRKVVEQFLYIMDALHKFKDLRKSGEQLRQELSQQEEVSNDMDDESDYYAEKVQAFKENSARLITNVNSGITYPSAPKMSTAIGAQDAREGEITNESIRSTISTYSMTLALIADSLDQLLTSRYQMVSLQQRASEALKMLNKCKTWIDERIKLLRRAPFETMLYCESMPDPSASPSTDAVSGGLVMSKDYHNATTNPAKQQYGDDSFSTGSMSISSTATSTAIIDEEQFSIFEKERDMVVLRFQQIESEELANILQSVHQIESDVDAANAVSVDRSALINQMEDLQSSHQVLKELIVSRGHELDALKRRIEWETQWSKSNSHIQTLARKFCDFNLKKVSLIGLSDMAGLTYQGDQELVQSLRFLQERLGELEERFLVPLADTYSQLMDSYVRGLSSDLPVFMSDKQASLKFKYEDLKYLASYTAELVKQRNMVTEFMLRVQDVQSEGEKIKEYMTKKTRRMKMIHGQQQQKSQQQEDASTTANQMEARVEKFKQEIKNIRDECCDKNMIYPTYNGQWLKIYHQQYPQRQQQSTDNSTFNVVKAMLEKRQGDLNDLENKIDDCFKEYRDVEHQNSIVNQYIQETYVLDQWINEVLQQLHSQFNVDVSTESFILDEELSQLQQMYQSELLAKVQQFENEKVKVLHQKVSQLINEAVDARKRDSTAIDRPIDVSMAAQRVGEVMEHLSHLKAGLSEHAYLFEVAAMRLEWEKNLQQGIQLLETMNDQLRHLVQQRNSICNQAEVQAEEVRTLGQGVNNLLASKDHFEDTLLPAIQFSYDQFVECFSRLPKPIAIPDHLEARMESLNKTAARVQEGLEQRSNELSLFEQRFEVETAVKKALLFFESVVTSIEAFIENKARWHVVQQQSASILTDSDDDDQEAILRTEWSNKFNEVDSYKDKFIVPLKEKFEQLKKHSTAFYDDNNNIPILSTVSLKTIQTLDSALERAEYYLSFSNEIITQRCLLSAFIHRTAQLEKSAELIHEEFIESKVSNTSHHRNTLLVDILEGHSERLKRFKTGVDDVRNNLAKSIPFPVRSLDDVPTQAKIKDESTNTVIQETISIRIARLDDLWTSLQELLESKERFTRRRLSLYTFKKQADIVEAWIQSHQEALSEVSSKTVSQEREEQAVFKRLRDAVTRIESIEQAMKAKENVFTEFISAFEKCVAAAKDRSLDNEESGSSYSEEQQPLDYAQQMTDLVYPTQKRLTDAWNELFKRVTEISKGRKALLIEEKVSLWQGSLRSLLQIITENEQTLETDSNRLSKWQESFHRLENKDYKELITEMKVNEALFSRDQIDTVTTLLNVGSSLIEEIRSALASAQKRLNLNQLIETHANAIKELQQLLDEQRSALLSFEEKPAQRSANTTANPENIVQRLHQVQSLSTPFKELSNNILASEAKYFNVIEHFKRILQIDSTYKSQRQERLEQTWNDIKEQESLLTLFFSRTFKWVELFDVLKTAQIELHQIEEDSKNQNADSRQQTISSCTERLTLIEKRLVDRTCNIADELIEDSEYYNQFETERADCFTSLEILKSQFDRMKADNDAERLLAEVKVKVQELIQTYTEALHHVLENESNVDFQQLNKKEEVFGIIDFYKGGVQDIQSLQQKLRDENELIETNLVSKLLADYNYSKEDTEQILQPLSKLLESFDRSTDAYKTTIIILQQIEEHINLSTDLEGMMNNCDRLLDQPFIEQHIANAENQLETIKHSFNDLNKLEQSITANDLNHANSTLKAMQSAVILVQSRNESIHNRFTILKDKLSTIKADLQTKAARTQLIVKLRNTLQFISNSKDRINAYNLNDQAAFDEMQEFNVVCNDFFQSYREKQRAIGELIDVVFSKNDSKIDSEVEQLQEEVNVAAADINSLINIKMKLASAKGDYTEFLKIMEEFDQQIASLTTAIEEASPHHSKVVNNKFVKSELQSLLKRLVGSFKEHQQRINSLMERAETESKKQFFLDDSTRITEDLRKTTKRWSQTKALAASREKELQTCINQLDHEFFTKLAIAKSSTAARNNALVRNTETSKHFGNGRHAEIAARMMIRRSSRSPLQQQQDSTSTSVTTSTTKVNQDYVPDPDNELDVRLSHIVNNAKYRIRVKSVPNQVGKYWFGDVNPRLVYCRILPSQMVMVRVGGGWVELTKFLKDHNLFDGSFSRPESSIDQNATIGRGSSSPFQETHIHTLRASSPSGRITIRGGGVTEKLGSNLSSAKLNRSTENRVKSPTPGFVDGDRFISIDEEGKQIIVKMKKAEEDAKMPIIIRKKRE